MAAIALCELVGVAGSIFTAPAISGWYAALVKPALNPPGWVFGPVWAVLYLLMGISLWLVWESGSAHRNKALWLFAAQLLLNAVWTPVFFGANSIGGALAILVLLWAAIVLTIFIFTKVSRPAAWLLVPYILWVSFALYLNFSIWTLNPSTPNITSADHRAATYTLNGKPITMASAGIKYFGNEARGDVNGDKLEDVVFLFTYDGGGSGTFYYVAAALKNSDGGYKGTNAFLVGDRIAPQTTEIREIVIRGISSSEIYVNFAERKPGEPFTARPSQGVTLYLKVTSAGALEGLMK